MVVSASPLCVKIKEDCDPTESSTRFSTWPRNKVLKNITQRFSRLVPFIIDTNLHLALTLDRMLFHNLIRPPEMIPT